MKKIQFIKESLKSLKEVGTILPSSKGIIQKTKMQVKSRKYMRKTVLAAKYMKNNR